MFYTKPKDPTRRPTMPRFGTRRSAPSGPKSRSRFSAIGRGPPVALVSERFAEAGAKAPRGEQCMCSPAGGIRMNTGVDDVANLSWKLAAMVQGWGGETLLDSYELERKPVAVRNTRAARAIAKQVGALDLS